MNNNKIDLKAEAATSYDIGGQTYTPAQVGTLTGKLDFRKISPYLGLGWGNAVGTDKKWGLALDLGLVLSGSPNVDLSTTGGLLTSDAAFQADLAREEAQLKDDISFFKYYPALSIGVSYRFK